MAATDDEEQGSVVSLDYTVYRLTASAERDSFPLTSYLPALDKYNGKVSKSKNTLQLTNTAQMFWPIPEE